MRSILLAAIVATGVGLTATPSAIAAPANGFSFATAAANATLIDQVQRCRCVERRWDGSCKLRVCRDHW